MWSRIWSSAQSIFSMLWKAISGWICIARPRNFAVPVESTPGENFGFEVAFSPQDQPNRPWQCLYFLPEPHGHISLRPTLPQVVGSFGLTARAVPLLPFPANAGASEALAKSSSPVV